LTAGPRKKKEEKQNNNEPLSRQEKQEWNQLYFQGILRIGYVILFFPPRLRGSIGSFLLGALGVSGSSPGHAWRFNCSWFYSVFSVFSVAEWF
jgi:hypothetical protein